MSFFPFWKNGVKHMYNDQTSQHERLIIISNRLPISISKKDGSFHTSSGSGGLITALAPVLKNRGGLWIGWPGIAENEEEQKEFIRILENENAKEGFNLNPIFIDKEDVKLYYEGFSNEIVWPLFHDLQSECHFDPSYWKSYQKVNRLFAEGTAKKINPGDFIWVHDYHLMLFANEIRKLNINEKIGFFLHIPFPSIEIFMKLPWRFQILRGLLEFDILGFQTARDQRNFVQCVKRLLPSLKIESKHQFHLCKNNDREVRIGAFPISIDYRSFSRTAKSDDVANQAWLNLKNLQGQKVVFSCDRLDISKGIPYRLEAIRHLLKNHPEIHEKVTFFQVVIPSRTEIEKYQELKKEIDRLVGEINSEFTKTGWVPIAYVYNSISRNELLAFYRIAQIALITPVKDGMNLVAKEFVASNIHENGVLILSEFAGAAFQLQHEALLINPYDIEGLAETIFLALNMPEAEIKERMHLMRKNVQRNDVFKWVKSFLKASISRELRDFPILEEFTPQEATFPSNV